MKNDKNIALIPEIIGALGSTNLSNDQIKNFTQDPKCFLADMNFSPKGNVEIHAAENSNDEVHLTLPFYSAVEEHNTKVLSDDNLEDISGGEIIVNLIFFGIIGGALAGTVYGVAQDSVKAGRNEAFEEITGEKFPEQGK